jgi:hypothetical protein
MNDVLRASCVVNAVVCSLPEPPPADMLRGAMAACRTLAASIPSEAAMLNAAADELSSIADVEAKRGNP